MERIDTSLPADVLHRRIRALNPWPGTSVYLQSGERLKIKRVGPIHRMKNNPGSIFERAGMVLLSAVDGAIELRGLQWEGKKEVDPSEFLNGLKGRGLALPFGVTTAQP
jgi:methionyl-tRNA formyltransferase